MTKMISMTEVNHASNALKEWFKSQDIHPADGMLLMEWFIAQMIMENGKGLADLEAKFTLIDGTIRKFVALIQKEAL